jgi:D-glycero-D-manno-heptose 1,7-bisphosphate phosphatase
MRAAEVTAHPVVILDRDGTIIADRPYLNDPAAVELLPGAAEGLRWLYEHGHRLVVITNQSGIGRGFISLQQLHDVHGRFSDLVAAAGARIERIYFCPHRPDENCNCRKPRLDLMCRAAADMHFDPANAIVIGDKQSDVEFGRRAGAKTILVAAPQSALSLEIRPDFVVPDLLRAARTIDRIRRPDSHLTGGEQP